jgi:uncharacterized membrane protein
MTVTQAAFRSGPLPEAAEMARYEQVLPGAADRIITMAEGEQTYRHRAVRREQATESFHALIGQLSALAVALAFGWWSYGLINGGREVAGSVLGVADLGVLVGLFLRRGE